MKKIIYSLLAMSVSVLMLTSCIQPTHHRLPTKRRMKKHRKKQRSRYKKMVKTF